MAHRKEIIVSESIQKQYDRVTYGDGKVYFPTKREQLILDALLNPDYAEITVKKKLADVAGVSYSTYTRAMNKPGFIRIYQKLLIDSLQGKVPAVVNAMYKFAVGNPSNHADRMGVLKLAGLVEDKKTIDINKKSMNVNMNVDNAESMATEDIKEMIKQMIREDPTLIEGIVLDGEK